MVQCKVKRIVPVNSENVEPLLLAIKTPKGTAIK